MKKPFTSILAASAFVAALASIASADPTSPPRDQTLHGVITAIQGRYELTVLDDRKDGESVTLHQGTIINPTGLQLRTGMQVTIAGHASRDTFAADKIDASREYFEVQEVSRPVRENVAPFGPFFPPNGTFQTNGPSAEGGG
jgi:hypothetical protein